MCSLTQVPHLQRKGLSHKTLGLQIPTGYLSAPPDCPNFPLLMSTSPYCAPMVPNPAIWIATTFHRSPYSKPTSLPMGPLRCITLRSFLSFQPMGYDLRVDSTVYWIWSIPANQNGQGRLRLRFSLARNTIGTVADKHKVSPLAVLGSLAPRSDPSWLSASGMVPKLFQSLNVGVFL